MNRLTISGLGLALAFSISACNGTVDGPGQAGGANTGGTTGQPGQPGQNGVSGTGGVRQQPGQPGQAGQAGQNGVAGSGGVGAQPMPPIPLPRVSPITTQADIHRLNRTEYANTIRDLVGIEFDPAALLVDSSAFGFDHISSVQTTTSGHVEAFVAAADRIVDSVIDVGAGQVALPYQADSPDVGKYGGQDFRDLIKSVGGGFWQLGGADEMRVTVRLPRDGTYQIKFHARPAPAADHSVAPGMAFIDFSLNSKLLTSLQLDSNAGKDYQTSTRFPRGVHTFAVGAHIGNCTTDVHTCGPLAHVKSFEIVGPLEPAQPNPAYARVFTCTPQPGRELTCAESIVRDFATRAWRRPLEPAQLQKLLGLVSTATAGGAGFNEAVGSALRHVLASPRFLYRVEAAADPGAGVRALDAHELASRLSYFLWSSMPDAALFNLAAHATLTKPEVLEAQVARMLADPKASALIDNFAGQWLFLRAIPEVTKDVSWHSGYDAALNADLAQESKLFFGSLLRGGSAMDLLTADYSFLNDRLRKYYGLPATGKTTFERTSLLPTSRRGVLGQAGLLSLLAGPKRSSPVDRGKWVLSQFLCTAPPPPPPGIPPLPLEDSDDLTMRDLMVKHRADAGCASCHTLMDPIGLALENYDAAGKWIDNYRGQPLDLTGRMPSTGVPFNGPIEVAQAIAADSRVPRCMVSKLFTYATARGPDAFDAPYIDVLTESFAKDNYAIPPLIAKLVTGSVFTIKRASAP